MLSHAMHSIRAIRLGGKLSRHVSHPCGSFLCPLRSQETRVYVARIDRLDFANSYETPASSEIWMCFLHFCTSRTEINEN